MTTLPGAAGQVGRGWTATRSCCTSAPWGHIPCCDGTRAGGRPLPRPRASVYAVGTDGKPLPMMCSAATSMAARTTTSAPSATSPRTNPTVIEDEFELQPRQVIVFSRLVAADHARLRASSRTKSLDEYTGPGLAVHWIEIEGPLDAWPPPAISGSSRGVPLKPRSVARAEAEGRPGPRNRPADLTAGGSTIRSSRPPRSRARMPNG